MVGWIGGPRRTTSKGIPQVNDAQRPPGRDTDRLDEMLDEDGTGDQDVRYLAPMPTRRPGADTSDDPTAATPIEPRPGGYARPAIDGAARERGRPGGWLAPVLVIAISLASLLAVFALTRSGPDRTTQPMPSPSTAVQSPSEPTPAPSTPAPSTATDPATSDSPTSPEPTPSETSTQESPSEEPAPQESATTPGATPSPTPTPTPTPTESPSRTSSSPSPRSSEPRPEPTVTRVALPGGVRTCGTGVGATGSASCPFANNIASAARAAERSGRYTLQVFSPTTEQSYEVSCQAGTIHVCRGGRTGVIYVVV